MTKVCRNNGELSWILTERESSSPGGAWNVTRGSRGSTKTIRNIVYGLVALGAVIAGSLIISSTARAEDSNPCGNIGVSAEVTCSAEVEAACETKCTPASFVLACDGTCSGSCDETATTECTQECSPSCKTECETNPGSFSCEMNCSAHCESSCSGKCSTHPDQAKCEASCRTSCGGECTASCTVVAPTETCTTQCETSCETSCRVQHNVECEVGCDIDCTANLEGGCKTRCEDPKGAIFCDGQFVDTGNNLQECIDYLESLEIAVDVSAWGSVTADASTDAEGGFSCAVMPSTSSTSGKTLGGLLALLPFIVLFRRRRSGR